MNDPFPKDSHVKEEKRSRTLLFTSLLVLSAFFLFVCVLFIREYMLLRHSGVLRFHHPRFTPFQPSGSTSPAVTNVELIENWMTFDYINMSFQLPPQLLRDELHISDPAYPRLSIRRAAKESGVSRDAYLVQVKTIVQNYLLSKNLP